MAKSKILASVTIRGGRLVGSQETLVDFTSPPGLNKSYAVSEVNDQHPVIFATYTREYERVFRAEPGYRIVRAVIEKISATRVSDETISISNGGSQVQFRFKLTSGPAVDRYRGWLDASLETKQEYCGPSC